MVALGFVLYLVSRLFVVGYLFAFAFGDLLVFCNSVGFSSFVFVIALIAIDLFIVLLGLAVV